MDDKQRDLPRWMEEDESVVAALEFPGIVRYGFTPEENVEISAELRRLCPEIVGVVMQWPARGPLALVGVCLGNHLSFLIHVHSGEIPPDLREMLEDPGIVKVGVGLQADRWRIRAEVGVHLRGEVDLRQLGHLKLRLDHNWSLSSLCLRVLRLRLSLPVSLRTADWGQSPLSQGQRRHAALQAYAALLVYNRLNGLESGNTWKQGSCQRITARLRELSQNALQAANQVAENPGQSEHSLLRIESLMAEMTRSLNVISCLTASSQHQLFPPSQHHPMAVLPSAQLLPEPRQQRMASSPQPAATPPAQAPPMTAPTNQQHPIASLPPAQQQPMASQPLYHRLQHQPMACLPSAQPLVYHRGQQSIAASHSYHRGQQQPMAALHSPNQPGQEPIAARHVQQQPIAASHPSYLPVQQPIAAHHISQQPIAAHHSSQQPIAVHHPSHLSVQQPITAHHSAQQPITTAHASYLSVHQPITTHHTSHLSAQQPITTHHSSQQPIAACHLSVHQPITAHHPSDLSVHQPITACHLSVHQPITAHHPSDLSVHQPITAHHSCHQPITASHLPVQQPITSHLSVHQPITAHHPSDLSVHQPITAHHPSDLSVHQPITTHHSSQQPITTCHLSVHQPIAAHLSVHQPITSHRSVHQPITSRQLHNRPVAGQPLPGQEIDVFRIDSEGHGIAFDSAPLFKEESIKSEIQQPVDADNNLSKEMSVPPSCVEELPKMRCRRSDSGVELGFWDSEIGKNFDPGYAGNRSMIGIDPVGGDRGGAGKRKRDADWSAVRQLQDDEEEEEADDFEVIDQDGQCPLPEAKHLSVLKRHFGHTTFKPMQWAIIRSIMIDRRDTVIITASGVGRSLCHQFPAVFCSPRVSVVICSLVCRIEENIQSLRLCDVSACFLGPAETKMAALLQDVQQGVYHVLYFTPESFILHQQLLSFVNSHLGVVVAAVDEAQRISQWSSDFDPKFQVLKRLKSCLPQVPLLALISTNGRPVLRDLSATLELRRPRVVTATYRRPALSLSANQRTGDIRLDLAGLMTHTARCDVSLGGPTLLLCPSPQSAMLVWEAASRMGVQCELYTATQRDSDRRLIRDRFDHGLTSCVVTTVSAAQEISKLDVRRVILIGAPRDMDTYCMAVSRAGRDGEAASCITLWSPADISRSRGLIADMKRGPFRVHRLRLLSLVESFLRSKECRRRLITTHYDDLSSRVSDPEVATTSVCCDNCDPRHPSKNPLAAKVAVSPRRDCSRDARLLLLVVMALGGKWGLRATARILRGSRVRRAPVILSSSPLRGCGRHHGNEWWLLLGRRLLQRGLLEEHSPHPKRFIMAMRVSAVGESWLRAVESSQPYEPLLFPLPPDTGASANPLRHRPGRVTSRGPDKPPKAPPPAHGVSADGTTGVPDEIHTEAQRQEELFKLLQEERQRLAFDRGVSPFLLATNSLLRSMARTRPSTSESLCCLHGVSRQRAACISTLVTTTRTFALDNSLQTDVFGICEPPQQPITEEPPAPGQSEASQAVGVTPSANRDAEGQVGEGVTASANQDTLEAGQATGDGQSEPPAPAKFVPTRVDWFTEPMRSDSCFQRRKTGIFF